MTNTRYIFLDDERIPAYLKDGNDSWVVYRTAEALLDDLPNILKSGNAVVFSLDHDLGEDILTGYDFVRMLVEMHMDGIYSLDFVRIQVHSANPVGAQNMRRLWDNFQRVILGTSTTP